MFLGVWSLDDEVWWPFLGSGIPRKGNSWQLWGYALDIAVMDALLFKKQENRRDQVFLEIFFVSCRGHFPFAFTQLVPWLRPDLESSRISWRSYEEHVVARHDMVLLARGGKNVYGSKLLTLQTVLLALHCQIPISWGLQVVTTWRYFQPSIASVKPKNFICIGWNQKPPTIFNQHLLLHHMISQACSPITFSLSFLHITRSCLTLAHVDQCWQLRIIGGL